MYSIIHVSSVILRYYIVAVLLHYYCMKNEIITLLTVLSTAFVYFNKVKNIELYNNILITEYLII